MASLKDLASRVQEILFGTSRKPYEAVYGGRPQVTIPKIKQKLEKVARVAIPPYGFYKQAPRIGRAMQKAPEFKIPRERVIKPLRPFTGLAEFGPQMVGGAIRSYGKTLEEIATPKGRKRALLSLKKVLTEKPSLKTLEEPAVRWALDIPDVFPGGLLFAGGLKFVGKEATEKVTKEIGEKVAKIKIKGPRAKRGIRILGEQLEKAKKLPISPEVAPKVAGKVGDIGAYAPAKPLKTAVGVPPIGKPSKVIIPEEKYAFNVNLERLGLTPKEKQVIRTTIDAIKPGLKKVKGKTLSNTEVVETARRSEMLTKISTRDETLAAEAAILKARQRMVELDKDIGRLTKLGDTKQLRAKMKDLVESVRVVSSTAADTGRKLQSFAIDAGDESIRANLLKEIGKTEKNTNRIVKEALKVDWDNARSITTFYRKFIKPSTMNILDEFRYNNMLSNPKTHLRNAFSNLIQTFVTRPATIGAMGKPVAVAQYYKGALSSFPEAVEAFRKSFTGELPITKPDIARIGTKRLPGFMTIPTRAMEAADKFFSALIKGGELARGATSKQAEEIAEYSLLRGKLFPEGQGKLLNAIDSATAWTYKAPKAVRWFVPFIRTPMNFAKQWLEYSPVGLATLPGAIAKKEQLAKVIVGSTITAIGAKFALEENTTWDVPTDPTQKELFYASGRKPFSVKIGDKWIPMMYAGPFAMAFAFPAAVKYYQDESRTSLTDSQVEKLTQSTASMARFLSGQTFLQGINNFVRFFSGDVDYSLPGNLAFTAGQMIPLEGLVRYISTIVDPIYRKGRGFKEGLKKSIPFVSRGLEPYTTPFGEPSRREPINYLLPYDIGVTKPQYEPMLQRRTEKLQENALINQAKKELERIKGGATGIGDKVVYWDEETATVKTTRKSTLERQVKTAQYSLDVDRYKRQKDYKKWREATVNQIELLYKYQAGLDETYQQPEKIRVQNKIEDLLAQIDKYDGYGGAFKKPKKGKKGRKPAKVTIRKVAVPKISFKSLGQRALPTVKLKKPPKFKVSQARPAKITMPSKALPAIKMPPASAFRLTVNR